MASPSKTRRSQHKVALDQIVETAIYLQAESRRLAKEQCSRLGITATQLNVLKLLDGIGDLSLSELSRRMAAKNSTITGIIDRMVAAKLVVREQCNADRRVWRISLTAKGRDLTKQIDVAPWDLLRGALNSLSSNEQERLIATLTKLAAHVRHAVDNAEGESQA